MRNFTITRLPDKKLSLLHNNVNVYYVGTCLETGISFYCATTHNYGVRVYPNGKTVQVNATTVDTPNSKIHYNAVRKQRYLQFKHAFGQGKHILVSHAVWMAVGRTIPEGRTMDHINGCTADNRLANLRCISNALNNRDGGFLRKLRNQGIDPTTIQKNYLLRYFARMAKIKEALTKNQYEKLDRVDLATVLCNYIEGLSSYFETFFNIKIDFDL